MYLNILDLVKIKLVGDVDSAILNYVKSEYGYFQADDIPDDLIDISIEFTKDCTEQGNYINMRPPVGYDDRGVFFHDPKYHITRVDFNKFGQKDCVMTCDYDFNPHFFAIIMEYVIHFYMLARNASLCHSSCLKVNDRVILFPAWRNVGKTNLLISFLNEGAGYIADDWSVVLNDGRVQSLPKRLNLLFYNFEKHKDLLRNTPSSFKALVEFVMRSKAGEYDLNDDVVRTLENQARMRISPYELFNQTPQNGPEPIDYVFLLKKVMGNSVKPTICRISREQLVNSINAILEFEQSYFHLAYTVFKAQTGNTNEILENYRRCNSDILKGAFSGVSNIYEVSISSQDYTNEVYSMIKDMIMR